MSGIAMLAGITYHNRARCSVPHAANSAFTQSTWGRSGQSSQGPPRFPHLVSRKFTNKQVSNAMQDWENIIAAEVQDENI
jgi:hypothetical protein